MDCILKKRKKRAPPVGGKGGFRGSPPENKKKSVDLGVDLGGYQGKLEFAPGDSQAFHYWEYY